MSDEGRPLPQRERGASEAGARPAATSAGPRAVTDDLRQRMQAAVDAERAQAHERATELLRHPPQRRVTGMGAAAPAPDHPEQAQPGRKNNGRRKRAAHSGGSGEPGRRGRSERHGKAEPVPNSSLAVASGPHVIVPELDIPAAEDSVSAEPVSASGPGAPFSGPLPVPGPGMGPGHPSGANSTQATPDAASTSPAPAGAPPTGPKPVPPRSAGLERPGQLQPVGLRPRRTRRRGTKIGLAAGVVVMVAAVSVAAVALTHKGAQPRSAGSSDGATAAATRAAVNWVVTEVDQKAVVSCDQATCAALVARGYPPNHLRELGPNATLAASSVVVVTPTAQHLFGSSLVTAWAPSALATFGAGGSAVSVRVVAPKGAAAYQRAAAADQAQRKPVETSLTQIRNITVSGPAAQELQSGDIDGRLFEALANAAAAQPIDIVDFGNVGSGASPDVPLRYADLAAVNPNGSMTVTAYVASLRGAMNGDSSARPHRMQLVTLPGGQKVLRVEFLAPSSFGLLASS